MTKKNAPYSEEELKSIYKIICNFSYKNKKVVNSLTLTDSVNGNEGTVDDFINNAYLFYIDKCYKNYDRSKGELSTHVYSCVRKQLLVLIIQTKYSISYELARSYVNGYMRKDGNKESIEKFRSMFQNVKYINSCSSTVNIAPNKEGKDEEYDSKLVDDTEDFADTVYNSELMKTFNDCLDNYLYNYSYSSVDLKRERDIILSYLYNGGKGGGVTYQSLAEKYGISRQRIEQIIKRFYKYMRNNKKFRAAINI